MTDRDRLIELFKKTEYTPFPEMTMTANLGNQFTEYGLNCIVDSLLANGVIVLPCQIGQRVYDIGEFVLGVVAPDIYELKADEMTIEKGIDGALNFVYAGMYINNEDIGETVFLTKEEAEQRLKELGKREGNY